jgi:hypothetical protein
VAVEPPLARALLVPTPVTGRSHEAATVEDLVVRRVAGRAHAAPESGVLPTATRRMPIIR